VAVIALPGPVRALLDGPNTAHLATVMPDGSPHCVPLWVALDGDRIAILTGPGSQKARNLERDSRVAISLTAHDDPFTMATIRGRVIARVEGDAGWELIDRIAHQYIGGPYPQRSDRVAFLIEAEHITAQEFR
jgi:PPOX class probable F420-dependent enzyme